MASSGLCSEGYNLILCWTISILRGGWRWLYSLALTWANLRPRHQCAWRSRLNVMCCQLWCCYSVCTQWLWSERQALARTQWLCHRRAGGWRLTCATWATLWSSWCCIWWPLRRSCSSCRARGSRCCRRTRCCLWSRGQSSGPVTTWHPCGERPATRSPLCPPLSRYSTQPRTLRSTCVPKLLIPIVCIAPLAPTPRLFGSGYMEAFTDWSWWVWWVMTDDSNEGAFNEDYLPLIIFLHILNHCWIHTLLTIST